MPYVIEDRRKQIADGDNAANPGDLNYQITLLIVDYLDGHGLSYDTCNDIVGALDNAKDEFKRRVQDPYEDKKIEENGDVYPVQYTT